MSAAALLVGLGLGSGGLGLALGSRFEPLGRQAAGTAALCLAAPVLCLAWGGGAALADPGFALWTGLFWSQLVALAWIDLRSQSLPDLLNLTLGATGLAHAALRLETVLPFIAAALGAGAAMLALAALRWRGQGAVGGGDVLLVAALGLWLGPAGVLAATVWGLIATLALGIALGGPGRPRAAFAPGLALGAALTWLCGPGLTGCHGLL